MHDSTDRPAGWPGVRFSPEALDMFCREFDQSAAHAVAEAEAINAEMAAAWEAYRAGHPGATLQDFALEQIEAAALELAALMGVPVDRACLVARRARAEAARRGGAS